MKEGLHMLAGYDRFKHRWCETGHLFITIVLPIEYPTMIKYSRLNVSTFIQDSVIGEAHHDHRLLAAELYII